MTVSYTLKVANSRFGGFSKLLFRWKGSIYKLLYKEFIVFVVLYALLSLVYRRLLTEEQKRLYTKVAQYCNRSTDLIPMSFVLGFYVTLIVNRWWAQYTSIPLPDQLMCVISSNVHGKDERGRVLRRTLIRYANLSSVLILRSVSTRVLFFLCGGSRRRRVRGGGGTHTPSAAGGAHAKPLSSILVLSAQELNLYRAKCSMLFHYDWISIPLVYTQVGVESPMGRCPCPCSPVSPVPLPPQVAEQIINPFGEDDDDFETNKLIDRNLQVSLLSVDDMYQNLPPVVKDKYWNESTAQPPYTMATAAETLKPSFLGSTFDMR
ncbi:Bestrophin-4 [Tyto alba]|uniref:Bestrophin homolog n=1 Tax=Tyto alba TaxID=56313 RepID=A0A093EKR4_TYTAL|nr:Bestrophin-4 [Tyto alba]